MTYTGHCPHCGMIILGGHDSPMKRIDTPIRTCPHCFRKYIDSNMYDWAVVDTPHRFYYYFLANNRWVPYVLLIGVAYQYCLCAIVGALFWACSSYLYVKTTKNAGAKSIDCCSTPGYLDDLMKYSSDTNVNDARRAKRLPGHQCLDYLVKRPLIIFYMLKDKSKV